jgi:drug/metabolite transporter (DMT)-like permease
MLAGELDDGLARDGYDIPVTPSSRAWLQIHAAVILWGFTAILGRSITLPALPLVWLRMVIVTIALMLLPRFWRELGRMTPRAMAIFAGVGVIVAAHWLAFYSAIKIANASVAASCIALSPVFVALIEPLLSGRPVDRRELVVGAVTVPGVALVVGGTPEGMRAGIAVGALAALLAATFSVLNKRFIAEGGALAVTGLEMAAGAICLTFVSPHLLPGRHDAALLLVLAIGCTLVPYALSLVALRHLTAFAATLAVNLEPVYAILLAIPLLGEQRELSARFYLGVALIIGAVFGHRRHPAGSLDDEWRAAGPTN